MNDRTALARDTLVVLAGVGPATGAIVRDELADYYGEAVNSGYFYTILNRLVDARLVSKDRATAKAYHFDLTQAGWRLVRDRRVWQAIDADDATTESATVPEVSDA